MSYKAQQLETQESTECDEALLETSQINKNHTDPNTIEQQHINHSTHIPLNHTTIAYPFTSVTTEASDTIDGEFLPSCTSRWDSDSKTDDTNEWCLTKTLKHDETEQHPQRPQVETLSPKPATPYGHNGCPSLYPSLPQDHPTEIITKVEPKQPHHQARPDSTHHLTDSIIYHKLDTRNTQHPNQTMIPTQVSAQIPELADIPIEGPKRIPSIR